MRIGYRHADRLISYPYAHNLSMSNNLSVYPVSAQDRSG